MSLIVTWHGRDDYSHGFIVPIISLFFIWADRERLSALPVTPNIPGGLILTLFGALMLIAGSIGGVILVQQVSLLIIIPGFVLLIFGTQFLRKLALPLAYLIFMVPVLDPVIKSVQFYFQLFSANLASRGLTFLGIPAFCHDQYIELPAITLEVADVCSGVGYLVSIIALCIPLAYFTQRGWKRKSLLFVIAIVIGILSNVLRIIFIGLWSFLGGAVVHGPLHVFQGYFVFVFGFFLLFLCALLLSRSNAVDTTEHAMKKTATNDTGLDAKPLNAGWLIAVLILAGLLGYLFTYKPKPVPLKRNIDTIPLIIGNWKSTSANGYEMAMRPQGADSELTRIYQNKSGYNIIFYIGYFESQRQNKELIHDNVRKLYAGADTILVRTAHDSHAKINISTIKDGARNSKVLFWYVVNGRILTNRYLAKFYTTFDGLVHRRTNGALVMVSGTSTGPGNEQPLLTEEIEFTENALPLLDNYIP